MMKKPDVKTVLRKSKIIIVFVFILFSSNNCGIIQQIMNIVNTLNNVNMVLDEAANNLNANAANYGQIMEEAIREVHNLNIKNQLQSALDNAIVTASGEIKCTIQFTGDYLIQRIQAIKAAYNHQPVPVAEPKVCTVLPSIIDMNLPANQRNSVQITGYFLSGDFSKYKLTHYTLSGAMTDRTSALSSSTDFKLQINLGSSGIVIDQNSSRLVLTWNNNPVSVIPVVQHTPEPCMLRDRDLTNLPDMMLYPEKKKDPRLNKSEGDREFDGNGPCTTGNVSIFTRNNNTEIWARVFVQMWECPDDLNRSREDYSYGDKLMEMKLMTVDYGWRIKNIRQSTYETFQNIDRDHATETFSGSGVVSQYMILGDTGGDDLGSSYVRVSFRPVKVTLEEIGDCVVN